MSIYTTVRRRLSRLKQQARYARLTMSGQQIYSQEVGLEKVFVGEQCATVLERWVERTGEWQRASCLLKDSPYVEFLQGVTQDPRRLDDEQYLRDQPYFRMAATAVEHTGSYFGARDPAGLIGQMRRFFHAYEAMRDGTCSPADYRDFRHSSGNDPLQVVKLRDSDYFELSDGHHRASILYVLGHHRVTARIEGEKFNYLQQLIVKSNHATAGRQLKQPLASPELADWPVARQCHHDLQAILGFLDAYQLRSRLRTTLDIGCNYGWFVDQFQRQGWQAIGITSCLEHQKIARIALALDACQVLPQPPHGWRDIPPQDLVLCLRSHDRRGLGLDDDAPIEILRHSDRLTAKVLFLELGRTGDQESKTVKQSFDLAEISSQARQHTAFKQLIPLERPSVASGVDGNEGALVACLK